jgi:hypothetical protein
MMKKTSMNVITKSNRKKTLNNKLKLPNSNKNLKKHKRKVMRRSNNLRNMMSMKTRRNGAM